MNNRKYAITFSQPTLTQQHSKDETDINKIMARYIKTGVIDHLAKYQPQYTDNNAIDYHESQNIIIKANDMFGDLPSSIRREFDNDPAKFLDYVQDPENHENLENLGKPKPEKKEIETPITEKPKTEQKQKTDKTAAAQT